jgi:hypothetical protein
MERSGVLEERSLIEGGGLVGARSVWSARGISVRTFAVVTPKIDG